MRFTGQNKKKINARYFLDEADIPKDFLPTSKKKQAGLSGCKGAKELQEVLVRNHPLYSALIAFSDMKDAPLQRFKQMVSDGVIGHYYVGAVNAFIKKILEKEIAPRNNINSGYTDDMEGYKAICRDIFDLNNMMIYWEDKSQKPTSDTKETAPSNEFNYKEPELGRATTPAEIGIKKTSLREAEARDNSYNRLKDEKNKKLFEALIKG